MSKVKGYVARDEDNGLWFYFKKPKRRAVTWECEDGSNDEFWIPEDIIPDFIGLVEWEGKPLKVELTIEKV